MLGPTRVFSVLWLCLWIQSNALAAKFEVNTTPKEAEIFVRQNPSAAPQKLGVTPFSSDVDEIFTYVGDSKTFIMEIKKEGFEDFKIMMVKSGSIEYKMDVLLEVSREIQTIKRHDQLMGQLFKAQKMIRSRNFDDAVKQLDDLEKDNKHFSIISELRGIAYYMNKDMEKSLSMFRNAFSLNPENVDAYKMKVYLEKKMGIDTEVK